MKHPYKLLVLVFALALATFFPTGICASALSGNLHPSEGTYLFSALTGSSSFKQLPTNILQGTSVVPDTSHTLCISAGEVSLNNLIDPNIQQDGVWTNPLGFEILHLIYTETALSGTYTYTVSEGPNQDTAILNLQFDDPTNAGPDVFETICGDGDLFDLTSFLDESADLGGTFLPENPIAMTATNSGVYIYTTTNACPADSANYDIQIIDQLGRQNYDILCTWSMNDYTVSFDIVGGTPPYAIEASEGGILTGTNFISNPVPLGTIQEVIISDVSLCPDLTIQAYSPTCTCLSIASSVSANDSPICNNQCTELEFDLVGAPPFDIIYSDGISEYSVQNVATNDLSVIVCPISTTTYTLLSVASPDCLGDSIYNTATVHVTSSAAGPDVTLNLCADSSIVFLTDYLPPEAAIGTFNIPPFMAVTANAGVYTYTTEGAGCFDDEAQYTVIMNPLPVAENLSIDCFLEDPSLYTVSLEAEGGVPPYSTTYGTFSNNFFTSDFFSVANQPEFNISIEDEIGCSLIITGAIQDNNGNGICGEDECDAGISPGTVAICDNGTICLFDLLEGDPDNGGFWTGPVGWSSQGSDCGNFSPGTDPYGIYTYAVMDSGEGFCTSAITITEGSQTDLGTIENIIHCDPTPFSLFIEANIPNGLSNGGDWYYPNTYPDPVGVVPEGIINPPNDPAGQYDFIFLSATGCATTASASITLTTLGMSGTETWADICSNSGLFNPYYALEGDPAPGGQWILYDATGAFQGYLPIHDTLIHTNELDDGGYFTYVLGAPPCAPAFTDLHITLLPGDLLAPDTNHTFCRSVGEITLSELIADDIEMGGVWINPAGEVITTFIAAETALTGLYTYSIDAADPESCDNTAHAYLFFEDTPNAGPDVDLAFCPDGTEINLNAFLNLEAEVNGTFNTPTLTANENNAGDYFYTVTNESCGSDEAIYNVSFHALPETNNLTVQCNIEFPSTYTVSTEVISGLPPYTSASGTFADNIFNSEYLSVGNQPEFTILIADQNGCMTEISGSIDDTDGDGICDDGETVGCQDPTAPNYNPLATDPGPCEAGGYEDAPDMLSGFEPNIGGGWGLVGQTGNLEHQWNFTVFPNPCQSAAKLQIALRGLTDEKPIQLELHDLTGRLVWKQSMALQNGIEMYSITLPSDLDMGTYLFSVLAEDGERKSKVLMINR